MRWVFILSASLLMSVFSGCSKHENLSRNCSVPADQAASFMPRVSGFPIRVQVDFQFEPQERESIEATIREWNQRGRSWIDSDLFQVNYDAIPTLIRTADPHQCGSELGGDRDFYVVRELNQAHWASIGFEANTPGATIRCYGNDYVERQIIFINPALLNSTQLDQAFSHEFGHALGLDHSCSGNGSSDYVACSALAKNPGHPYLQAVMNPTLKFRSQNGVLTMNSGNAAGSSSRVSSVINSNDEIRGQCITGPTN